MTLEEKAAGYMESNPDRVVTEIKSVFGHPNADMLLTWLMDTCSATETTIDENPIIMAAAEGRRQVWVALNKILSFGPREINEIRQRIAAREADRERYQ